MNLATKTMRLAIFATVFAFVSPVVFAGTVTVQHGTLSATLGAPVNFSYTPDWRIFNDPTHTIGLGLQPYATLGSTLASVQCQGSANLSVSQNPGWNTLSLTPSSGTATMNLGFNAGLNIEFIAFGNTLQGSLSQSQNWGFEDNQTFSSYLLDNPVTLSGQISQTLVSLNTLDALTLEFGIVIPSWLAGINLDINAVANLNQTISGANINTSAGAFSSEEQSLNVYTSGTSYQLQNMQETWSDSATLSLGLGADMSADLLDGILSVQLVNFGNVTLISASQTFQLQSSAISTVSFDLSTGSGSIAPMVTTISPSTLTGLPVGQTQLLSVIGSGFTSSSTLTFNDGVDAPFTGRVPTFVSGNELDYNISTGTNQANWTVQVVNGAQTSSLGHFTVNAPTSSPTATGSLVVNLTPSGIGGQWQVDNTGYNSSGQVAGYLTPGSHSVSFKPVSGYSTPANEIVTINANAQTTAGGIYSVIAPSTYTLALNYNNIQGGASPSPLASGNIYTAGALVQIYASASSGYHFTGWSGDANGTANPTTITMNGNKNVTANFASGDPNMGTVIITIQPPAAAAAGVTWGFNASDFRASGSSYTTWPSTYILSLHPVDGWLGPSTVVATITAGQTTNITVSYTPDTTPGLLTVTLSPPDAVTAGAQWHVNGGVAQGNGATASLLPGTNYIITFDTVSGWAAPPSQTVTVTRSQTTVLTGNYTPPAGQPVIGSVSPPIGSMTGGTLVTINGVNFTAPTTVLIGGQPATNVLVNSATQISCFTPSNSIYGTVPVVVQASGGSATNLNGFAYGFVNGSNIDLVNSFGGSAYGIAVQGNYAYVSEGRSFLVVNVSSPTSPSKVGQVTLPGLIRSIALLNQYAYVADQDGGVQVVDVSNPSAPTIRGYYATAGWATGIAINGSLAYVADQTAGLDVLNLGTPTLPTLLSSTNCGGTPEAVVVSTSGNNVFAYMSTYNNLCVVDVTQPSAPVLRGQTQMGGGAVFSLAVSGNYVFGASLSDFSLHMVDVSNPDVPVDSTPSAGGYGSGLYSAVATANNYLYAESFVNGYGLNIFSINGTNLTRIGSASTVYSSAYNMAVSGNSIYVAARTSGLDIVGISNPSNPSLSGLFVDSGAYSSYNSVAVTGDSLCADAGNLMVFDVSQPGQVNFLSQLSGISEGRQVLAQNGIVYDIGNGVGSTNLSTRIISLATPSSPQLLATLLDTQILNYRMTLSSNMLYVVGQNGATQPRFAAVDVSSPSSPVVLGFKDYTEYGAGLGSIAFSVAVSGTKAFVGIQANSVSPYVSVLDISSVSAPVEIGSLTNVGYPYDIQVSPDGNYVYIMDTSVSSSLRVISIGDLADPVLVTNVPLNNSEGQSLAMRGSELFAVTYAGIYVFDITNPSDPQLMRTYAATGISGISVPTDSLDQSDKIYAADQDGGVIVLREPDIQPPSISITNPSVSSLFTNSYTINMAGIARDNVGVTSVTWVNNQGGGGNATGTTNWSVTNVMLLPGTNVLTVTAFDQGGNSDNATLTVTYQSTNQNQSITFPAITDYTFGDPPIQLVAAASSGLPVIFSVVSGQAILSNSNILTLTGAGAVTVEADQFGNSSFNPAMPVDVNFNVARAGQSIAFAPLPNHAASDPPFALTATASSGLPVYFNILSGSATLDTNNVATLLGAGTVTVIAWQPGNSNYNAAASVPNSFNVSQIPQTITFGALSQQKAGDAPFVLNATASSGLPVSFSISGPAELSGNILAMTGGGTVTVTASQPGNNTYAAASNVTQSLIVIPPDNTLLSLGFQTGGDFQMAFYGTVGSNYTFQSSTDLMNWLPLFNFICTNSPTILVDTNAISIRQNFYRLKQ